MAFPSIVETTQGNNGARSTSLTVNMPAVLSGLLVLIVSAENSAASISTPTGFSALNDTAAGGVRARVFWKEATGAEGATIVVTHSNARSAYVLHRITGHGGVAPQIATATDTSAVSPNPPSVTPSWGAGDTLWIAAFGMDGSATVSAYPTSYSDGIQQMNGDAGGSTASAWRQLNASPHDPPVFTTSGAPDWVAITVAIRGVDVTATAAIMLANFTFAGDAEADPTYEIINAQLAGANVRVTPLVRFDFVSGEKRVWHGFGNLVVDGETWEGLGNLGRISEVTTGPNLAVEEVTFTLAGTEAILEHFSDDAEESAGRDVRVYFQFLNIRQIDEDGNWVEFQPLSLPWIIFWGVLGPLRARRELPDTDPENARAVRSIEARGSGSLVNRSRPPFGFYSETDQNARVAFYAAEESLPYVADNIFARVDEMVIAKVRWPKF